MMIIEKHNKPRNMKLQSRYILTVAILIIAAVSCKKDLIKTNTDPNAVSAQVFDPNNILNAGKIFDQRN